MAPSDTGDRWTDRQNSSYTVRRSFIAEGVSVSVRVFFEWTCANVYCEHTRITVDKCLWEQMCRCMCVAKAGGHRRIKPGPKDEHLIGLGRIDGWLHRTNGAVSQAGVECGDVCVCVCVWATGFISMTVVRLCKSGPTTTSHLEVRVLFLGLLLRASDKSEPESRCHDCSSVFLVSQHPIQDVALTTEMNVLQMSWDPPTCVRFIGSFCTLSELQPDG